MQGLLGLGGQQTSPLAQLGSMAMGNNQGILGTATNLLGGSGLLNQGFKVSQNEQRLMQEKMARNQLKKYLTSAGGDPIQSALISRTIPGRGALDDFDVGLGSVKSMGSLLGSQTQNNSLLGSLGGNYNLGGSNVNTGFLSNLVNLAKTPNSNSKILSNLGGMGTGIFGNSGSGFLGQVQSGINTLNALNKVSNAVSGLKSIF